MTKTASMPFMAKTFKYLLLQNPKSYDLGMQHKTLKRYKICINDDPGLTLTYFMARLNLVAYAFEQG